MTPTRRTTTAHRLAAVVVGGLLALPVAGAVVVSTAAPAQASSYRYWTYWWGTDTGKAHTGWRFASQGPAFHPVGDRWVLGWRFATSTVSGGTAPRALPGYDDLCRDEAPTDGSVRVALVIDYGTTADAPPGESPPTTTRVRRECLVLPARSTGATALSTAGIPVRDDGKGLICGLDGYPRKECAPVVADPTPTSARPPASSSSPSRAAASASAAATRTTRTATESSSATPSSPGVTAAAPANSASGSSTPALGATGGSTPGAATTGDPTLPAVAGAPVPTSEQSGGSPAGLGVGALVITVVGGSAYWTSRRGGRSS